jgi:hypothetical protein
VVVCSIFGMDAQITGAAARKNALVTRYSLSRVASTTLVRGPGRARWPRRRPAPPDSVGMADRTPSVIWRARRLDELVMPPPCHNFYAT